MAADLAKEVLAVYVAAEERLLALLAARLAEGIDAPGWAERKLIEVQALRAQVAAVIADLAVDGPGAAETAVRTAYNRGVAAAGAELTQLGAAQAAIAFGVVNQGAVEALVVAARDAVGGTHLRISRTVLDVYQRVTTETAAAALTGTATRRTAAQEALTRYTRAGVTGFVDKAGRGWDLASYAEMATRTAAGQGAVQGHVDRLVETGNDLVIISDAPQECAPCRPWEGKVLSLTGATTGRVRGENIRGPGTISVTVAGTLRQATAAGLFHPNCRHRTGLYIPGVTRPLTDTEDPQGDADRQRQRALERAVRKAKRQQAVALDEPAARAAAVKVRTAQTAVREHVEATDGKRLYYREQIGKAR